MGIEIEVNSLEEMCDLMCDNIIPKGKEGEHDREGKTKGDRERKAQNAERVRVRR